MEITANNKKIPLDWIFLFRLFFTILGWTTIIIGQIRRYTNPANASLPWWELIFGSYRYFTMQTNFLALTWLSLGLIWYNKPQFMDKINGWLKGAINAYVTGMMLLFALLLSYTYHPTGFDAFSNIILHYIIPLAFIVDWFLSEKKKYKWNYLISWIIYPYTYLGFAEIHGLLTGDYLYPFLDFDRLGPLGFSLMFLFLTAISLIISSLYIFINRKMIKNVNTTVVH